MLPPIVHNLVMVPIHQDVIKPKPENPPVQPTQASDAEPEVSLAYDDSKAAVEEALAEQKRRRKQGKKAKVAEDQPQEDVRPEERPRQGFWIDVEV